jgi:hypothetical protein
MYSPDDPTDKDEEDRLRRRTPWLALLVFSPDELKCEQGDLDQFLAKAPAGVERKQSETFSVRMTAQDVPSPRDVKRITNAISFDDKLDAREATEALDVIFVPKEVFVPLFTEQGGDPNVMNISRYKYMAHVRQIATDVMAVADQDPDSTEALFSMVLSHRTPFIGSAVTMPASVYLVSLGVRGGLTLPSSADTTHVSVLSLYS